MQTCPACKKEFRKEYEICPHCGYIVSTPAAAQNNPAPKKTKRIILAAVLAVLAVGIAVFAVYRIQKGKTDEPTAGQSTAAASETDEAGTGTNGSAQTSTEWIAAYKTYLLDMLEQIKAEADDPDSYEEGLSWYFTLLYLDDDDIPELVVSGGDYHASSATLVTFYAGKTQEYSGLGSYGSFGYKEKQGVLVEGYAGSGVSSSNVWHLSQGVLTCTWSGQEDWFDETAEYYIFDADVMNEIVKTEADNAYEMLDATRKQVSKEEYESQYDANVPTALTASQVNSATAPRMTQKNVETYFAALADRSTVTRIRTYTDVALSGTADKAQTDYNGNAYQDLILDEPVMVQFEDDAFPALLTYVRFGTYEMDSLKSGHTEITVNLYKDSDDVVCGILA